MDIQRPQRSSLEQQPLGAAGGLPPGPPASRRIGSRRFDSVEHRNMDTRLLRDILNPSCLKSLYDRIICSLDTIFLGIADACKWGAYAGVWGGAIATGMVTVIALPTALSFAAYGGAVALGESIVEGGLKFAENRQLPGDQFPILLSKVPIEGIPVIGDFVSFSPLKNLPYQGDDVGENLFTFVGSRVSAGVTFGFLLGAGAAITSLNPLSILATGAVTALAAFSVKVAINVGKVVLNFLILTNFEMKENYREFKRSFNKPIRKRIVENVNSVLLNIQPQDRHYWSPPKDVQVASRLLGIPRFRVSGDVLGIDQEGIDNAAIHRIRRAAELFPGDDDSFDRLRGLFLEARRVLLCEIKYKQRKSDKERIDRANEEERRRAQDQSDRNVLGLPEDEALSGELIDEGYAEAVILWNERFKSLRNADQLVQAQRRLRQQIPSPNIS